jgi:hypothetical protein
MKRKERQDLLTGEPFIPLRINQRFIIPANRIKYYNDKANERRHNLSSINKLLHINYSICIELLDGKVEGIFHKQFLLGKGFSLYSFTHYEEYEGRGRYAIYNYLIIVLEKEQIKIIKYK